MPSDQQSAANRANRPEGKANTRYNPLKHGINAAHQVIFAESAEDLAELDAEYRERHRPDNPTERFLVDTLIHNEWRLRRLRRVEAELWLTGRRGRRMTHSAASTISMIG
jgi:hypothetical protein